MPPTVGRVLLAGLDDWRRLFGERHCAAAAVAAVVAAATCCWLPWVALSSCHTHRLPASGHDPNALAPTLLTPFSLRSATDAALHTLPMLSCSRDDISNSVMRTTLLPFVEAVVPVVDVDAGRLEVSRGGSKVSSLPFVSIC